MYIGIYNIDRYIGERWREREMKGGGYVGEKREGESIGEREIRI